MKHLLFLFIIATLRISTSAQAFQADNSFGNLNNGRTLFISKGEWRAIDRQGENYIVVGKYVYNNVDFQAIVRFFPNGDNDNTAFSLLDQFEGVFYDVAVASDSTIYACGVKQESGSDEFYLVKFDKNGFKIHEIWLPNNMLSIAYRLKLLPNHDVLVCGRTAVVGEDRARLVKLHDDGAAFSLVSTFGTNGIAKIEDAKEFSFVPGASSFYALTVATNGKIYAAGSYVERNSSNTAPQPFYTYWKADGTPDTVVSGYSVTSNQNGLANEVYAIAVRDTNLFSAGYKNVNPKIAADGSVRILNDALSNRQGKNGLPAMVTPLTASQMYMPFSKYYSVVLENKGAYYFGGSGDSATGTHVCIGKINSDLEPETTFNNGSTNYSLPFDTYEQPSAEMAYDALVDVAPNGDESFIIVGSETFHSDGKAHPMIVKVIPRKANGIQDELANDAITIFPNPATQMIQIKAEHIQSICITDLNGKDVFQINNLNTNSYQMDVSALSPSCYFIRVNENTPQKLIKTN